MVHTATEPKLHSDGTTSRYGPEAPAAAAEDMVSEPGSSTKTCRMGDRSICSSARRWLGAGAWVAWLGVVSPAHADPLRTVWSCWLHEAQNLACIAAHNTAPAALRPASAAAGGPTWRHRQPLYIPLHSTPFDNGFVAELAQSVLCGGKGNCETRYWREFSQLVAQAPSDFADAFDPVLVAAGD